MAETVVLQGPWRKTVAKLGMMDPTHLVFEGKQRTDLALMLEEMLNPLFWPDDDLEISRAKIYAATRVEIKWTPGETLEWLFT